MENFKSLIQLISIITLTVFLVFIVCIIMGISIAFAGESIQTLIIEELTLANCIKIFLIGLIPVIVTGLIFTITFVVIEKITNP